MNVHVLQHVPFEGLNSLERWLDTKHFNITKTRLFDDSHFPDANSIDWLIILGGPMSVNETHLYPWLIKETNWIEQVIAANKTVLGVCLGAQLIAKALGSEVRKNRYEEIGWHDVFSVHPDDQYFGDIPETFNAFHWHGDTFDIPQGAKHLARSEACENQAYIYDDRVLGLQFHLEATLDSVVALTEHSELETENNPYVQTFEMMIAEPNRFIAANKLMHSLLERLEKASMRA